MKPLRQSIFLLFLLAIPGFAGSPSIRAGVHPSSGPILCLASLNRPSLQQDTSPAGYNLTLTVSDESSAVSRSENGTTLLTGVAALRLVQSPPQRNAAVEWRHY
jgi:hypothetical protein